MLVREVPELAPLPSIERLAERQAVHDVRDIRAFHILRFLGLMRSDVKVPGHAVHEDVARDAAARVVVVPVVSARLLLLRGDASQV